MDIQEAVRKLRIVSESEGVVDTTRDLKGLSAAHKEAAATSEQLAKAGDAASRAMELQRTKYEAATRKQLEMAALQRRQVSETMQGGVGDRYNDYAFDARKAYAGDRAAEMQYDDSQQNGALSLLFKETGVAAADSGLAMVRWGRILLVAGAAATTAAASYYILTGRIGELGDKFAGVGDAAGKAVDWFSKLDGSTVAVAGAVGLAGAALLLYNATAKDSASASGDLAEANGGVNITMIALGAAAGLAAGAVKLYNDAMTQVLDAGKRMEETRLGLDVIEGLALAAAEARAPLDEVNKAIDHFTELTKKSADDSKDFYKALGNVDDDLVEAFKSAPTQAARLKVVSEAMSQATGEVQRYQVAQQAFGTDNDRVIAALGKGADAVDDFTKRARDMGLVFDGDLIAKAQEAQKDFNVLSLILSKGLTVAVVNLTKEFKEIGNALSSAGDSDPVKWVDWLIGKLKTLTGQTESVSEGIRGMAYDIQLVWDALNSPFGDGLDKLRQAVGINLTDDEIAKRNFYTTGKVWGDQAAKGFEEAWKEAIALINGQPLPGVAGASGLPEGPPGFEARPKLDDDKEKKAFGNATQRITDRIQEMQLEAEWATKTASAVTELRIANELRRAAEKSGLKDDEDARKKIAELAKAYADAEAAARSAKLVADIRFDRDTMFRPQEDQQIAQKLRPIYGNDVDAALNSYEAGLMRVNNQLRQSQEMAGQFASSFMQDIRNGVPAVQALTNALGKLADQLIQMATNRAVAQLFGGLFGVTGGAPGAPLDISYQGGGATSASIGANAAGALSPIHHSGGIVGQVGGGRYIHPAYFDDAPRYHSGGIVGRERPIIAMDDEEVLTRSDPRHRWNGGGRGAGSSPVVNVSIETPPGHTATVEQAPNGSGGVDIKAVVTQVIQKEIGRGAFDKSLGSRFGNAPTTARR